MLKKRPLDGSSQNRPSFFEFYPGRESFGKKGECKPLYPPLPTKYSYFLTPHEFAQFGLTSKTHYYFFTKYAYTHLRSQRELDSHSLDYTYRKYTLYRHAKHARPIEALSSLFKDITSIDLDTGTSIHRIQDVLANLHLFKRVQKLTLSKVSLTPTSLFQISGDRLVDITLSSTHLMSLYLFQSLPKLKSLRINDCPDLVALDNLERLTTVENLTLKNSVIKDFSSIAALIRLKYLNLFQCCYFSDYSMWFVMECTELKVLNLSGTAITKLDFLENFIHLKALNISFCPYIQTLNGIETAPHLEELDLSGLPIKEISDLSGVRNLTRLDLPRCEKITSFESLSSCYALEKLDLSRTRIQDLKTLFTLKKLKYLNISYCSSDITLKHLEKLPQLRKIFLTIGILGSRFPVSLIREECLI